MNNIASELFLLTTNLSQLKNRDKIVQIFLESIHTIFSGNFFKWFSENDLLSDDSYLPVCTRAKTYGYIQFDSILHSKKKQFALFQNAIQLIAIILERLEQEELLRDQKVHLQGMVDEQTSHLIQKQNEINELNEEFASLNEELVETNKWLLTLNEQLNNEVIEHKKDEKELRQSEEKFKNVFEHASVGKSITSIDGSLKVNKAFCNILGYTVEELSSKKWQDITHPEDIELNQQILQSILNGEKESADWQKRYIHKNGNIVWVTISTSIHRDDNGEPLFYITTINDITDQKLMQEELQHSEQLFSNIFYNSPVAIIITSRGDGKIVDANKTFLNNMEFQRDEVVGNSIVDLGIFYDLGIREKLIDTLMKNGFVSDFECTFHSKTGKISTGLMSMSFIHYKGKPHQLTTVIDITKRKKAESILLDSERLLNESQRISGIGSYVLDINSGIWSGSFYLNEMFCIDESSDHSLEGMVSMIHPHDQVMITSYFINHVIGKKERFDKEFRFIAPKGKQTKWMHAVGELEFDLIGNPVKMFGTIRDITNRKLIEIELHNYEKLLNESQRISGIGSYILNIEDGTWSGSLFLNEMFGINELDDHSVEGWLAVIHPEDQPMMASYFNNEVLGKKGRFDKEYRIVAKNSNKERWVHGIGELELNKEGNPIRMIGTIRDNTDRKKAEEELRKLLRAVEQSPDSILITDIKGQIEYANPAIQKLSGYTNEELIGNSQLIFNSGQMSEDQYGELWEALSTGNIWQGEFQNIKKNGELYWESATISPVMDITGKIKHYLSISEDITEKKKLTQELIEAKEHAEESDRLKSSFLANMSHEIRTPMNSIMGFASLLPEEESKELMCQYANIIVQNSEQLVSLIDSIVMYSKLQSGLFAFKPSIFEVHQLFNDIQQSFNLPMYQQGVTLKIECNLSEKVQIYSDYDKLRQIITNLIVNAFKYTSKGEIALGCTPKDECFNFFLRDTGIGIPEKDLEHIFERFYRGSNIDEVISRGTGLGLCIVKELVEMLGGNIWVESEVAKGSTFYFTIPKN